MNRLLDTLFAPLARLMVARGIAHADAVERLKLAQVRAARVQGAVTDSKVSVLTGLQRREVVRLSALPDDATRAPINHPARLVALWAHDPLYNGRDLTRRGPEPSFEALALKVRRDVHPRTQADQLIAAGTVVETPDGLLRLVSDSYQPLAGSEAQLDYLAANVGDHLSAAVTNVLSDGPRRMERAAHFNGLSADAVAELEALWQEAAMAGLQAVAARAQALQSDAPGSHRFRAGAYLWSEEES